MLICGSFDISFWYSKDFLLPLSTLVGALANQTELGRQCFTWLKIEPQIEVERLTTLVTYFE